MFLKSNNKLLVSEQSCLVFSIFLHNLEGSVYMFFVLYSGFVSIYNQDSNKVLLQYKLFFHLYFVITKISTACIGFRYHCQIIIKEAYTFN